MLSNNSVAEIFGNLYTFPLPWATLCQSIKLELQPRATECLIKRVYILILQTGHDKGHLWNPTNETLFLLRCVIKL